MNHPHLRLSCAFLLALTLISPLAPAASVTWGAPQNITGNSDVSTNGSLIGAFNVGETGVSATTVNGVNFQSFALPSGSMSATVGNFNFSAPAAFVSNNSAWGSASPPFSALSPEYRMLLVAASLSTSPLTLTISGLIVGMQYEFQWWANDSRPGDPVFRSHTATAGNTVTLDDNPSNTNGGPGQFAIGTFTADAATQSISFGGTGNGFLNGFQLRQSAPAGVPESGSSLALLVLALGAIACARRALAKA